VIIVEDWAEIRCLHRAEQMPIKAIARLLGVSKNTVRRAVRLDARPGMSGHRGVHYGRGGAANPRVSPTASRPAAPSLQTSPPASGAVAHHGWPFVLALSRGGVPVGYDVARAIDG
jgi:hypothetical protein